MAALGLGTIAAGCTILVITYGHLRCGHRHLLGRRHHDRHRRSRAPDRQRLRRVEHRCPIGHSHRSSRPSTGGLHHQLRPHPRHSVGLGGSRSHRPHRRIVDQPRSGALTTR
jgi:hypothetical protein